MCEEEGCQDAAEWPDEYESAAGNPLLPHTDGYVYGDHLPDVIFLLAEVRTARRTCLHPTSLFALR